MEHAPHTAPAQRGSAVGAGLALLVAAALLAGCAARPPLQWSKPNVTAEALQQDMGECEHYAALEAEDARDRERAREREAVRQNPALQRKLSTRDHAASGFFSGTLNESLTGGRSGAVNRCMRTRGYQLRAAPALTR